MNLLRHHSHEPFHEDEVLTVDEADDNDAEGSETDTSSSTSPLRKRKGEVDMDSPAELPAKKSVKEDFMDE